MRAARPLALALFLAAAASAAAAAQPLPTTRWRVDPARLGGRAERVR